MHQRGPLASARSVRARLPKLCRGLLLERENPRDVKGAILLGLIDKEEEKQEPIQDTLQVLVHGIFDGLGKEPGREAPHLVLVAPVALEEQARPMSTRGSASRGTQTPSKLGQQESSNGARPVQQRILQSVSLR